MLRRGRDLRGPLLPAGSPGRRDRHDQFAEVAHEATARVAERAGLRPDEWGLTVLVAPHHDVPPEHRLGHVEAAGSRWEVVLHRLALTVDLDPAADPELVVECTVARLLGAALGRPAEDLHPDA